MPTGLNAVMNTEKLHITEKKANIGNLEERK